MATTSHGLSVYVNSCVKNPLDPRTRASTSFSERQTRSLGLAATDPGPQFDVNNEFDDTNGFDLGGSLPVRATGLEDVETQLKALTDEQFYLKLQQLKDANRKTLQECEKLYKQKYASDDKAVGNLAATDMVEEMFAARLAARSGHVDGSNTSLQLSEDSSYRDTTDRVRDLSSKPPRIPTNQRDCGLSRTAPMKSGANPTYSGSLRQRPGSAPSRTLAQRRSYSMDDEDWRRAMRDSDDISDDEVRSEGPVDQDFLAAVTKIRDMWHGFKINDYTPGERRHSSASAANKKKDGNPDLADNWRHRITIPKPFRMSMRETDKPKKKTKAQEELEQQRREKRREEEEECQKKFKAQPAPAHIYLPLYDEIQEKNETRRRQVKMYSKELLKSQEKPFNFAKREEEKKQQRAQSSTVAERIARSSEKARRKEAKFVARPAPSYLHGNNVTEKLLEEEEYRKIRMKMRSRELLKEASLPPNMAANQKIKEQREKEKLMKAKQKSQGKRRGQRSSHRVPDYDFLYREFQKELSRRKHGREATVTEPFALETNRLRSSRERVLRDMDRDEELMRDTARRTPRTNLGVMSSSMDSIPCMSTNSADLRTGVLRTQQERSQRWQEQQEETERRRAVREGRLRKYIMGRSDGTPRTEAFKGRLKRHKEADNARLEQYEKDLQEMKDRVERRPLLFERETQVSAGKAAEKKFKTTLRTAGIDEQFLRTRSSAAPSARSDTYDEEEGEDNLTFTKSAYDRREEALA